MPEVTEPVTEPVLLGVLVGEPRDEALVVLVGALVRETERTDATEAVDRALSWERD